MTEFAYIKILENKALKETDGIGGEFTASIVKRIFSARKPYPKDKLSEEKTDETYMKIETDIKTFVCPFCCLRPLLLIHIQTLSGESVGILACCTIFCFSDLSPTGVTRIGTDNTQDSSENCHSAPSKLFDVTKPLSKLDLAGDIDKLLALRNAEKLKTKKVLKAKKGRQSTPKDDSKLKFEAKTENVLAESSRFQIPAILELSCSIPALPFYSLEWHFVDEKPVKHESQDAHALDLLSSYLVSNPTDEASILNPSSKSNALNFINEEQYEPNPLKTFMGFSALVELNPYAIIRYDSNPLWVCDPSHHDTLKCPAGNTGAEFVFQVLPYIWQVYANQKRWSAEWSSIFVFRCHCCRFFPLVQSE